MKEIGPSGFSSTDFIPHAAAPRLRYYSLGEGRGLEQDDEKEFDLGVLFIHGIGTQARGQTLAQCGGPLFRWMEERCHALEDRWKQAGATAEEVDEWRRRVEESEWSGVGPPLIPSPDSRARDAGCHALFRRVALRETRFRDPEDSAAPAHSMMDVRSLELDGRVTTERWLLAESWWAETFLPPTFADLARWSLRIVPWTIGSHFVAQIKRRVDERPGRRVVSATPRSPDDQPGSIAPPANAESRWDRTHRIWMFNRWLWRTAAAVGGFGLGLISSIVILPLLALVLVLGTIPIPQLRNALLYLQLRIAGTLGDSYVLLSRPIEAASIIGEVRRDLRWMATRCKEVVLVAHSQGGAVAHLALRDPTSREIRLLFTFGSGLRKLEELRQLDRDGASFALSAVLTTAALGVFLLCITILAGVVITGQPASLGSLLTFSLTPLLALVVCAVGIRDHLRRIDLPELDRWMQWLKTSGVRWTDCYASADPVPNGIVTPAAKDRSHEVCNQSSTLQDHTTYWSNRDQFVSLLYGKIARSRERDPLPDLLLAEATLEQIAQRRRWRVALRSTIRCVGVVGVLVAIVLEWQSWLNFGAWGWQIGTRWMIALFGMESPVENQFSIAWLAIGILTLIAIPYWFVQRHWTSWNEEEMQRALRLESSPRSSAGPVLSSLCMLEFLIAGLIYGEVPPFWVLFPLLVVPVYVFMVLEPSVHHNARDTEATPARSSGTPAESPISSVDALLSGALAVLFMAALPFSWGLALWIAVVWIAGRVSDGVIAGFRPDAISSFEAGGTAVLLAAVGWAVHFWWSRRAREAH